MALAKAEEKETELTTARTLHHNYKNSLTGESVLLNFPCPIADIFS